MDLTLKILIILILVNILWITILYKYTSNTKFKLEKIKQEKQSTLNQLNQVQNQNQQINEINSNNDELQDLYNIEIFNNDYNPVLSKVRLLKNNSLQITWGDDAPIQKEQRLLAIIKLQLLQQFIRPIQYKNTYFLNQNYQQIQGTAYKGYTPNEFYVLNNHLYFLLHPQKTLPKNYYVEKTNEFWYDLIETLGDNAHPEIKLHQQQQQQSSQQQQNKLAINITIFETQCTQIYQHFIINQHILSIFQIADKILGSHYLTTPDYFQQALDHYQKNNSKQCFNIYKFIQPNYKLHIKSQCQVFFKAINKNTKQYIIHEKIDDNDNQYSKVKLLNTQELNELIKQYESGKQCGSINKPIILEQLIQKPLLINSRKVIVSVHLLIASTKPYIGYIYPNNIKLAQKPYKNNQGDILAQVPNNNLTKLAALTGKTLEDVYIQYRMSFDEFKQYLIDNKILKNNEEYDKILFKKIKASCVHIIKMSKEITIQDPRFYQMFEVNFELDEDLNIYLKNIQPEGQFDIVNEQTKQKEYRIIQESNHLVVGFQRKRNFKILNLLQKYAKIISKTQIQKQQIPEKYTAKGIYNQFLADFKNEVPFLFEYDFDIQWIKIIDESLVGANDLKNILDKSCY